MAGRVLSQAEASAQIELDSGKRVKVKTSNILLQFEKPAPAEFMAQADAVAATIELELAWEFAPEVEFSFADLARDYFNENATLIQQAGALFCLFNAPHYFRRAGKGRFRKAPAEIVQQALLAIEKKKQIQLQISEWAEALGQGECPAPIREQLYKILFKPDKNTPEYKAVVEASRATQLAPLLMLQRAGAINNAYQFHWKRFLFDNFPKGVEFPKIEAPLIKADLPLATVQAYSIDDAHTTEIDDALSVQGLGSGQVTIGIHIAAPALAFNPNDPVGKLARSRFSTVYMPGHKITMLPDAVVQSYTLQEGTNSPAISLYATFDEATLALVHSETKIERVPIAANMRLEQLEASVTEAWLEDASFNHPATLAAPAMERTQLAFLFRLAKHLKAQREVVRGKPENFNRPDYNFQLVGHDGSEPEGSEQVTITPRKRGAPLDLIVSEAMILANSTWGSWLGDVNVPGIYRSQASMLPGVKVRMGTKALPHAGIGVKSYAWSTSPLRRYVDLVNQWQIIAVVQHGATAALAAPFKPKDTELFAIISGFDEAYSSYNSYQSGMERFWTLQYLQQNHIAELNVTVFKENFNGGALARADDLPLVLPVFGLPDLPRGANLRVRLGTIDTISLDVNGTVLERLDSAENADLAAEDEDDGATTGAIAIAVDLNEPEPSPSDKEVPAS